MSGGRNAAIVDVAVGRSQPRAAASASKLSWGEAAFSETSGAVLMNIYYAETPVLLYKLSTAVGLVVVF